MKELQQYLLDNTRITTVYVNNKGEWLFIPRPAFEAMTREELLEIDTTTKTKRTKK